MKPLALIPRRTYSFGPTPLHALPRLSEHLGGPQIYVKRDDLLGLAGGGNKTRKLEFLMADAIAQGADSVITVGAVQSNHCRLTLSAAVQEGMECHLVLEERVPHSYDETSLGNNLLFQLLGAASIRVVEGGADLAAAMEQVAAGLRAQGRTPYVIPGGGSNALGALGYVACAQEILAQTFEDQVPMTHVVTPSGSGGTHAGLVAGFAAADVDTPITGISVRPKAVDQIPKIQALATAALAGLGHDGEVPQERVRVLDQYVGAGYSLPTPEMTEAIQLFARHESILLDPVYTGKAAAGLIGMIREGELTSDDTVLFVHTGGAPALHAYRDSVLGEGGA